MAYRHTRNAKSEIPPMDAVFAANNFLEDEAEDTLVKVLEERKEAREGQPLAGYAAGYGFDPLAAPSKPKLHFRDVAMRVSAMRRCSAANKSPAAATQMLADIEDDNPESADGIFENRASPDTTVGLDTDTNRLISGAVAVEKLFREETLSDDETSPERNEELLPLTSNDGQDAGRRGWFGYGSATTNGKKRKKKTKKLDLLTLRMSSFSEVFNGKAFLKLFLGILSRFVFFGLPCIVAALLCYYKLGRPRPEFLLKGTSLSWWLLFFTRQWVTFELSLITQYFVVDVLALRTRIVVTWLGSLLTLCIIQARGAPFVMTAWAIWDMFILHGDDAWERNWLYMTGLEIFTPVNPGADVVLHSPLYLRVLIALLVAGLAHAVKRTWIAMYFGKRLVVNYKPRLEKLLKDIVLVAEVAELSRLEDALVSEDTLSGEGLAGFAASVKSEGARFQPLTLEEASVRRVETDPSQEESEDDDYSDSSEEEVQVKKQYPGPFLPQEGVVPPLDSASVDQTSVTSSSMRVRALKSLLDRWNEPVNKLDDRRSGDVSIGDMLRFRKALAYMDDRYPFSRAFGEASTRDDCIKSAQVTYFRLLGTTNADVLSFNAIALLAVDEHGKFDERKQKALRRVFRPDRFRELSLVAFVQCCDTVYKHLRFFRASVANVSVMDRVLESILDSIFNFFLALIFLILLNYNPWPLLVSITTLIVSMAFAIGPSVSRMIEGILLIAARRPFDIGDRILLAGAESASPQNAAASWFVENINLFSTTIRYAPTNEVATVNNGAIALLRITNCAKSSNALVTIILKFLLEADDEKIGIFHSAVAKFVTDRPRTWDSILFFQVVQVDTDLEFMAFELRLKHVKSWQATPKVMTARAELVKFCFETGNKLGINSDGGRIPRLRIMPGSDKPTSPPPGDAEHGEGKVEAALQVLGL